MELTDEQHRAMIDGLRAEGCACEPNIIVKPVSVALDGPDGLSVVPALDVTVAHDDWCPLLAGQSMN